MVPAADQAAPAGAVIVSFDVTTGDADAVAVDELDRGRRAACAAFFCLTKICAFRDPICHHFLYRVLGRSHLDVLWIVLVQFDPIDGTDSWCASLLQ